jgi:hypothetical protein
MQVSRLQETEADSAIHTAKERWQTLQAGVAIDSSRY